MKSFPGLQAVTRFSLLLSTLTLFGCNISVDIEGGLGDVRSGSTELLSDIWCDERGGKCAKSYLGDVLFLSGTKDSITLTASSNDEHYEFDHWEGNCNGSTNPTCEISLNWFHSPTAVFRYVGGPDLPVEDLNFAINQMEACLENSAGDNGWTLVSEVTEMRCDRSDAFVGSIAGIEALPQLQRLTIQGWCLFADQICSNPTVTDMTPLAYTPDLERLHLEQVEAAQLTEDQEPFEDNELDLPKLPALTHLTIRRYGLKPRLPSFRELPALQQLDVRDNPIEDISRFVNRLPDGFQSLWIDTETIPCEQLQALLDKQPGVLINDQADLATISCVTETTP